LAWCRSRSHTGDAIAICRHVEADHNVLHCHGGDTRPQNCNLLPQSVHAEKSRRDTTIAAKVKRIADAHAAFCRKLLAKQHGLQLPIRTLTRKGNLPLPCSRNSPWRKPLGKFISIRREPR
jgi:hypothetical protein